MDSNRIAKLVIGGLFIIFGVRLFSGTNNTKDGSLEAYDEMELIMQNASSDDNLSDGSVVALSGKIMIDDNDIATDELTAVSVSAAYLRRKVEAYQWVRDCGEDGDDCRYKKEWSEEVYESDSYDESHQNVEWSYKNADFFAENAKIGKYKVSDAILKDLPTEPITDDVRDESIDNGWKHKDDYFYSYDSSADIGDLRIRYERNRDEVVSVLAMVSQGELVPFKATNGKEVFVVHAGEHDAGALMKMAHTKTHVSNVVMIILSCSLIAVGALFVVNAFKKG